MKQLLMTAFAVLVAGLGVVTLTPATYASTYDAGTNTIYADGTGLDGANGAAFVEDNETTTVIISGTLDNIRAVLTGIYGYVTTDNDPVAVAGLTGKLAKITSLTISIQDEDEATVYPSDIGFISFLKDFIDGQVTDSEKVDLSLKLEALTGIAFNLTGQEGTEYTEKTIADVIEDTWIGDFALETVGGSIRLPDEYTGSVIDFFGGAEIAAGNSIVYQGKTFQVDENSEITLVNPAELNITGLDFPQTLPSADGTVSDEFKVSILSGDQEGVGVVAEITITTTDGDLTKVKLWNTAFSGDELLSGDGSHLGATDYQSFPIGTETTFNLKVEIGKAGTYAYEISLVSSGNTSMLISKTLTGTIVVNPYVAPSYSYGGGGGGGGSYYTPTTEDTVLSGEVVAEKTEEEKIAEEEALDTAVITEKVNILTPIINLIFITPKYANEATKEIVKKILSEATTSSKNPIIRAACKELLAHWEW